MSDYADYIENLCDDLKDAMDTLDDNRDDESYERVVDTLKYVNSLTERLVIEPPTDK